jgi:hypothetical protein
LKNTKGPFLLKKPKNNLKKLQSNSLPGTSKHVVIPDVQVKPTQPFHHLQWVGRYIAEKKPDYIHCIGDFADMPSLSSYDNGKREYEGRRYKLDIEAAKDAMLELLKPIKAEQQKLRRRSIDWVPQFHMYLGNHEQRIIRATNLDPKLDGLISVEDLQYDKSGWNVHPFLQVGVFDGIAFSHYFTSGAMGRPVSTPRQLVIKKHHSCVMGHVQQRGVYFEYDATGKKVTGIFAGVCYLHDESYLSPQENIAERGIWVLQNVTDGDFNELYVPLDYLQHKYK